MPMVSSIQVEESTGPIATSSSSGSSEEDPSQPQHTTRASARRNNTIRASVRKGKGRGFVRRTKSENVPVENQRVEEEGPPLHPDSKKHSNKALGLFRSQSFGQKAHSRGGHVHDPNSSSTSNEEQESHKQQRRRPPLASRPRRMVRRWRSAEVPLPPTTRSQSTGHPTNEAMRQTRVFTVRSLKQMPNTSLAASHATPTAAMESPKSFVKDDFVDEVQATQDVEALHSTSCATAILQHSYLELCGSPENVSSDCDCFRHEKSGRIANDTGTVTSSSSQSLSMSTKSLPQPQRHPQQQSPPHISDDPTVQESIECVFASQLGENLALMLQQDDDDDEEKKVDTDDKSGLVAPSVLQQSLLRSRSERTMDAQARHGNQRRRSKKLQESLKLVHVSTFDPNETTDHSTTTESVKGEPNTEARVSHATQCPCCRQSTPIVDPKRWPQRPLLLRPTPSGGTVVKGIRKVGSTEYLWKAGRDTRPSALTWPTSLKKEWGQSTTDTETNPMEVMCPRCMILPINNGNEASGESLVTDFESELFEGTLLLRMRATEGTTPQPYNDNIGYFHGMNRRYQAVIHGRFKKAIPFTQCLTGFVLDRPCGKLPPKWILKGGLKVLSFFAPQLQARFDGPHPSSLTPLGSTPQVLSLHDHERHNIEKMQQEPTQAKHTLLGEASDSTSTLQRARYRKKHFDKLFTQKSPFPVTDPNKVYTFEFLQHLFNFNDFSIELGSMLGAIKLKETLDGQPLQIMAMLGEQRIWSFDVWHEVLIEESRKHDKNNKHPQAGQC